MPNVIASVMHIPGVTETNKNVGINAPSNARLTITTSTAK
jgi:hypothetical protein